jgi:signal transduction histidine kinase/ActR/RegA family two-component response regulator
MSSSGRRPGFGELLADEPPESRRERHLARELDGAESKDDVPPSPAGAAFVVDADLRYLAAEGDALKLAGLRPEDLIGKSIFEALEPELASRYEADYRRVLAGGSFDVEHESHGRSYLSRGVPLRDAAGRVYAALVVSYDTTHRKHAAVVERRSEEILSTLIENAPFGVFIVDDSYRVRTLNKGAEAVFGAPDVLPGRDVRELLPLIWSETAVSHALEAFARTLRTGEAYEAPTIAAESEEDAAFNVYDWRIQRLTLPDGSYGVVWYLYDLTPIRRAERALRQNEEQLREMDRRKDEFLAVLAHELRNPLAPIRTGLELLRLAGDTPESVAMIRGTMERQLNQLVRLVDDLLDVSRITSGKLQLQRKRTTLEALVNTAVEAHRLELLNGRLELIVDMPSPTAALEVDASRIVQVISNLLHNAIKFTEAGGLIRVEGAVDAKTGEVLVTVTDTGVGISRDILPRVFELFEQGDTGVVQGGLGIGLSLARRLVELHGGSITAASDGPGHGSAFTVRLPAAPSAPEEVASGPVYDAVPGCRVLVVDDNADAADTMGMLIDALGGQSCVAYHGESALAQVVDFQPDVVLLDLGMPDVDGYETCRRMRPIVGANTRIIALTGRGQARDREQTAFAGFDDHLTKPADLQSLKRLLARPRSTPSGEQTPS